jgi:hypothetical protein
MNFSGCEASIAKVMKGVDRYVANRALQNAERFLEMSAASMHLGETPKRKNNKLIAPKFWAVTTWAVGTAAA